MMGYCMSKEKKNPKLGKMRKEIAAVEKETIDWIFDQWMNTTRISFDIRKTLHYHFLTTYRTKSQAEACAEVRRVIWYDEGLSKLQI